MHIHIYRYIDMNTTIAVNIYQFQELSALKVKQADNCSISSICYEILMNSVGELYYQTIDSYDIDSNINILTQ